MSVLPAVQLGDDVEFLRDAHAYVDVDGTRRMSLTQAIRIAGLVDYSMVAPAVMQFAASRGTLVHQATALLDKGIDLSDYEIPEECEPYVEAYKRFTREMEFVPDPLWIERPMIIEMFGRRVGMTPDAVGTIQGVPTVVERKCTASAHPSWGIQTAGQLLGLRTAGLQIRQRLAVQLLKTGKYILHPHTDAGDFETFADAFRIAAWKLKHNLAKLA
jgi:hypothetical protein